MAFIAAIFERRGAALSAKLVDDMEQRLTLGRVPAKRWQPAPHVVFLSCSFISGEDLVAVVTPPVGTAEDWSIEDHPGEGITGDLGAGVRWSREPGSEGVGQLECWRGPLPSRPLYTFHDERFVFVASTVRALLLTVGAREPNPLGIEAFLWMVPPCERTFWYRNIRLVPSGARLCFRARGDPKILRLADPAEQTDGDFSTEGLRESLERVIDQLWSGQGALGCELSGGVDSSVVTAVAAAREPPDASIHSFTHAAADLERAHRRAGADWPFVEQFLERYPGVNAFVQTEENRNPLNELAEVVEICGYPPTAFFAVGSGPLFRAAADRGCARLLSGLGGDQFLTSRRSSKTDTPRHRSVWSGMRQLRAQLTRYGKFRFSHWFGPVHQWRLLPWPSFRVFPWLGETAGFDQCSRVVAEIQVMAETCGVRPHFPLLWTETRQWAYRRARAGPASSSRRALFLAATDDLLPPSIVQRNDKAGSTTPEFSLLWQSREAEDAAVEALGFLSQWRGAGRRLNHQDARRLIDSLPNPAHRGPLYRSVLLNIWYKEQAKLTDRERSDTLSDL